MPYRPPGGIDWNRNGTYDWSDRLKDYRAYEIVTGHKHPLDPDAKKEWSYYEKGYSKPKYKTSSNMTVSLPTFKALFAPNYRNMSYDREETEKKIKQLEQEYQKLKDLEWVSLEKKRAAIRNCDMVIGSRFNEFRWRYIAKNPVKGAEMLVMQMNVCSEYCKVLSELLRYEREWSQEKKELYVQSCKMCIALCNASKIICMDNEICKQLIREGQPVAAADHELGEKILLTVKEIDKPCKIVTGMQMLGVEKIMKCLDKQCVFKEASLQKYFIEVAEAYDKAWYAFVKRFTDCFLYPTEKIVEIHWKCYQSILEKIPQKKVDSLDETSWKFILRELGTTYKKAEYVNKFRMAVKAQRDARRKIELPEEIEKFESENPDVCRTIEKLEKEKREKETIIEKEKSTKIEFEKQIRQANTKRKSLYVKIQENQKSIDRLSRKFFGNEKDRGDIEFLKKENVQLEVSYKEAFDYLQQWNDLYQQWQNGYLKEEERLREVKRQINNLKEKTGFPC